MNLDQTMQVLKAAGTEQTRRTYARHGYPADTYGVSFAELKKLAKKLDGDQDLARQLWATGNGDACTLATMIADPEEITPRELDEWVKRVRFAALAQMLARYVADTDFAREKADEWVKSPDEFVAETGYHVLSLLAVRDEELDDEYFEDHLRTIESSIHQAKNRVRYGMNQAVISIGVRNPKLTKLALSAAKRIGKVEVDHGNTACETPDAALYIQKTLAASK
jgi:3-methyladenine DNA glycosylase AlkD